MLYTCQNPILEIETVGRFSWKARSLGVAPRPYCALAFRLQGGGNLSCGDKTYQLQPGDVLYMPQGLGYHHHYTDTDLMLFHFITVQNDGEPEIYRPQNPEEIWRQFQKAISLWEEKKPGYLGQCMGILYKILGLLAENEARHHLPPRFLQAVERMHRDFARCELRIGDLCRDAQISETVFRQLFHLHYGKAPVEYLTELRLENARNLISHGLSVESAALQSGFSDAKYFSRVCKRHFGCTPRQLRIFNS